MTYKAVLSEPYTFKDVRKMVDSCAFSMYGHWVKKTQDQLQNRGALFENKVKQEIIRMDAVDGQRKIPSSYSYQLTHAFLPKRPSFARRLLNSPDKQAFSDTSSNEMGIVVNLQVPQSK